MKDEERGFCRDGKPQEKRVFFRDKKHMGQLAALICVLAVLCCFTAQKEGYHMDELLSFELANAEFNPWIVPTQPVGRLAKFMREEIYGDSFGETCSNILDTVQDVLANRGESRILQYKADVYPEPVWIGREQFQEYLTAGGSGRFNYLSVYFNVKDDNHPPLHFMLLHTMCSLFPGTVAPFLGCIINIAAVLGCCICFFSLGTLLESKGMLAKGYGGPAGICAGLLYGLSAGAVATTLLIRMYGLMTFFCVASFYLHVKKWTEGNFAGKNGRLAAVTVLGFWTQYFFLFYCLALAAVTAGLLTVRRRYRELKAYIRTMLLSAVVGVLLFPFAVQDVFSSGRGEEALQNLGQGLSGYGARLQAFGAILLKSVFGRTWAGVLIAGGLALCLCLLWVKRKSGKQSADEDGNGRGKCVEGQQPEDERKRVEGQAFWLMLTMPCLVYFLLAARMSPYMVDRYIMPLFPFGSLLLALALVQLAAGVARCVQSAGHFRSAERVQSAGRSRSAECVQSAGRSRSAERVQSAGCSRSAGRFQSVRTCFLLVPAVLLGIFQTAAYDGEYLYRGYEEQLETAEKYRELPCICLYDGLGYYYNLMEFTEYERTLLLRLPELEERKDTADLEQLSQIVVLKKSGVEESRALEILEGYGWKVEEELLSAQDSVYGDTVYLCVREGK